MTAPNLYIGLMSGTSVDGIDAALVRFDEQQGRLQAHCLAALNHPWDSATRNRLIALGQGGDLTSIDDFGALDYAVADAFASAACTLLAQSAVAPASVAAIGSHGQTVRHRPYLATPFTLQIGNPALIVERTGITTVAHFRRRDMAAGGHGAPLLPALHAALLAQPGESRAVLNLGGIANLTLLPADGHGIRGFDTGPANALMDAWCEQHTGQPYDKDGALAAQGRADADLLARLLDDPWFAAPPPKSTGREHFHLEWLGRRLEGSLSIADVQATLAELTARTVADALRQSQPDCRRLLIAGGGAHNPILIARIAAHLPEVRVEPVSRHGLDPDHVEAIGFAWLARQTLHQLPGNLPSVTGASGSRILGAIYPA